jgi:alpha-1,2-mannosyltransferase
MKRRHVAALFAFLALNVGIDFVLHRVPSHPVETSTSYVRGVLRLQAYDDSWGPMKKAIRFQDANPTGRIYQALFFDKGVKFQYPPTSLLGMEALRVVDKELLRDRSLNRMSRYALWLTIVLCGLIFAEAGRRHGMAVLDRAAGAIAVMALALLFYPITRAYCLGQIQTWINLLVAASVFCWLKGWAAGAGALMAVAALVKPQLGLLLPWALLRRRWSFSIAWAATAALGLAVSLALYGLRNHIDYIAVASFMSRHGEVYFPNQSINGFLHRLLFNGDSLVWEPYAFAAFNPWVYGGTLVAAAVLAAAALFLRRSGNEADFSAAILAATIASPIAWEHHFGIMMPILAAMAPAATSARARILLLLAYFVGGLFYQDLITRAGNTPWNFVQSYLLFSGLLLLGWLWFGRGRKSASSAVPHESRLKA